MIGTYEEITERMRIVGVLKNDSAIARELELTPQALSNYKKRGKMPSSLVVKFAEKFDCSLDYLFKGIGEVRGVKEDDTIVVPCLDMELIHGDSTIMELNMAYRAVGFKLKRIEIESLTEIEKIQIDKQLGRYEAPKEPEETETPKDSSLKVAPDAIEESPETEKLPEESVATEESDETTEPIPETEETKVGGGRPGGPVKH